MNPEVVATPKAVTHSKTIIFNVLSIVVIVAGYFGYAQHQLPTELADLVFKILAVVTAIPVANIGLRFATKQPVAVNPEK